MPNYFNNYPADWTRIQSRIVRVLNEIAKIRDHRKGCVGIGKFANA